MNFRAGGENGTHDSGFRYLLVMAYIAFGENANRAKLSVISTVTNKGQMRWKVFSGALNPTILIGFLKRLVHGREKRVLLILDNLRVHHSKLVRQWLKTNKDKIVVFNLPS